MMSLSLREEHFINTSVSKQCRGEGSEQFMEVTDLKSFCDP